MQLSYLFLFTINEVGEACSKNVKGTNSWRVLVAKTKG